MNTTSYDLTPYVSYPYPQSSPERLAVLATLMGGVAEPMDRCRVLELGSCAGGNLLPLAEHFCEAQFEGIDASARQIADAEFAIDRCQLTNARCLHKDIRDIDEGFGKFDYIIAHGVYSWVPQDVREKILQICSQNLNPNGVAYVSYNTYPGWRMRGIIRDIMLYRARGYENAGERLKQARHLVDFLAKSVPSDQSPYGLLLKREFEMLKDKEEHYLIHEHLESVNEPCYFNEFIEAAGQHGLSYLAEADFGSMSMNGLNQYVQDFLNTMANDRIEIEQYLDFVRNRTFRQTLLVKADQPVKAEVKPERLMGLYVASQVRPDKPITDLKTAEKSVFRGKNSVTTTVDPLVRAALLHLGEIYPKSCLFQELLAVARAKVQGGPAVVDTASVGRDVERLGEPLLRCYETGAIELSTCPPPGSGHAYPYATRYARYQAANGTWATNLKHSMVDLNDVDKQVLQWCDGNTPAEDMEGRFLEMLRTGKLLMNSLPVDEGASAVREMIDVSLAKLARQSLLF